jgi:hypothetical protein
MARSKLDTLVYSTILVAPLATALVYIATVPTPAPVVVLSPAADCAQPAEVVPIAEELDVAEPAPILEEPVPPATAEPPPAGAGVLMFERRLALATDPDTAWGKGSLRGHTNDYGVTVTKAADMARLPSFLAALAGQSFTVYAADGSACIVDAGPMSIYARVDGQIMIHADEELAGDDMPEEGGPSPAQLAELRRDVYADHAELLVARPEGNARCDGLWARRTALPAPAVFGARAQSEEDRGQLAAAVAPLLVDQPAVAALATSYAAWYEDIDPDHRADYPGWSDFYLQTIDVRRWDEIGGDRSYLTVDVGSPGEACSTEFSDHASFVLARSGDTWQVLEDPGFWRPQALMDLDRDGHLEAVLHGGFTLDSRGPDRGLSMSFEIPWWGCPC